MYKLQSSNGQMLHRKGLRVSPVIKFLRKSLELHNGSILPMGAFLMTICVGRLLMMVKITSGALKLTIVFRDISGSSWTLILHSSAPRTCLPKMVIPWLLRQATLIQRRSW